MNCPLCLNSAYSHFYRDKKRDYFRCSNCQLVFVPDDQLISDSAEKAIYDLHENEIGDEGYRNFLNRLAAPLTEKLTPGSHGLDFGCGPGPALADMLTLNGFKMDLYDLFYYPDKSKLRDKYEFITATEVIEHIKDCENAFNYFEDKLKSGGILGLMTKLVIDQEAFSKWHYKNDLTHIRFYSLETFKWVAENRGFDLEIIGKDVILLQKK